VDWIHGRVRIRDGMRMIKEWRSGKQK
jgi:Formyl transferase, C-terminal domain